MLNLKQYAVVEQFATSYYKSFGYYPELKGNDEQQVVEVHKLNRDARLLRKHVEASVGKTEAQRIEQAVRYCIRNGKKVPELGSYEVMEKAIKLNEQAKQLKRSLLLKEKMKC